jgi:rhomboid protease GluP
MTDDLTPTPNRQHPLYNVPPPAPPSPAGDTPPAPQRRLKIARVRPLVMYVLVAANVLIFLAGAVSADNSYSLLVWGANQAELVFQGHEFYRLFTAMFLHASIYTASGGWALANSTHIIFNMYILYAVGMALEPLFGHVRFAVIYLLGGLAGSVLSALLGNWQSYSIGASGAVFAILGAEFVFLYHHRQMMGAQGAARRRSLINLAVINILFGLLANASGSAVSIDNWAHMGGLAGGVILAWFFSPKYALRQDESNPLIIIVEDTNPWQGQLWVAGAFAVGLVVLLVIGMISPG